MLGCSLHTDKPCSTWPIGECPPFALKKALKPIKKTNTEVLLLPRKTKVTGNIDKLPVFYLFLYSTSRGHTVSTAIFQSGLMRSHKSPLDRDVDLLMHWGNKTLFHMELEVSVLKYTQCGSRCSRLLYTLSPPVMYPQALP